MERKSGVSARPLQEAVVAFSNSEGGIVLIGVDDSGRVIGKALTQGVEESIHQAVSVIRNPGRYSIQAVLVDDVPVTILAVERRVQGFAQTSSGRIMVRRGAMNAALFDAELFRFVSERSLERFELSDVGVALAAADEALMAELSDAFEWAEERELPARLEEQGLLVPGSEDLSVAGALYLLRSPDEVIGKAFVEIRRYADADAIDPDKRVEIRGPLHHQVASATEQVMQELGTESVVLGLRRHDLPRLPRVVVREAIANAVVHRSYEATGSCVQIEIRPGAVTVSSPGSLPSPVTIENIREAQSARNPKVIALMRRFRLAEDAGRGVDVMQDSMMEELLDPPSFQDTGHSVKVALPVRGGVTAQERAWVREIEARGEIEPMDRILLVHAARGEELTNSRVRELAHVDRFTATQSLQRLRNAGFLTQQGERGGAVYLLEGDLEPPAGLRLGREELKTMVCSLATEGPVSNAEVRARTGLDRVDALRLLRELVEEGRLTRRGERRGTRYVACDADG
ncbi:MAG TPA: ATP-binding protein [Solirubrobacterales bacterium]|nr:ATP-binding protein [Solirubrobacterales bacterium]